MRTFENTKMTKAQLVERVQAHYDADEIAKGSYWEDGEGCCVGCWTHSNDHKLFATLFGIDPIIAHLADSIFEGLPNDKAKEFPLALAKAIPERKDLSLVHYKFLHWAIADPDDGVIRFNDDKSIKDVANLFERKIKGEVVSQKDWDAAGDAAGYAAAAMAAWAAGAAAMAARAAAGAADGAAAGYAVGYAAAMAAMAAMAARAARAAGAADGAARDAAREKQADKLIELIRNEG